MTSDGPKEQADIIRAVVLALCARARDAVIGALDPLPADPRAAVDAAIADDTAYFIGAIQAGGAGGSSWESQATRAEAWTGILRAFDDVFRSRIERAFEDGPADPAGAVAREFDDLLHLAETTDPSRFAA